MSISHRDSLTGRIAPAPDAPENPFQAYIPPTPMRDGRSDHRRAERPQIVVRLPQIVYDKLHALAENRRVTVTHIVLEALFPVLEPALRPALQGESALTDSAATTRGVVGTDGHVYFGLSQRRERLADRIKSPVIDPIPAHDAMGRSARAKEERKFVGLLVDRPKR